MIGATEEKSVATGENFSWVTFNFTGTKPTLTANTSYILSCWSIDTCFIRYDPINSTIGRYNNRVYNSSPPDPISWDDSKPRRYSMFCSITTFPEIKEVSATPNTVGFGGNVTLSANISDTGLIECVMVNISYPDETFENSSMINIDNDTYQYVFTDTWLTGQYNYAIWATDEQGTTNSSTSHSFNLTVNATIQVCTIKDTYTDNETINITDPPNENTIGYQFLDNNQTLLIYNPYDTNYINTTSGIQLTNHKDDFWSHNVLMLGYYDDGVWKKLYRTDELTDFTMDIESDNETYVNVTFWKDVLCKGYPARLAIRYHLGEDDTELMIIPYIKNLGNFIPYQLAFGWELKDIQIDMTTTGDYLEINGTAYYLNTSLNNSYTNLSRPIEWWNETTNQTEIIGWEPRPNFYIKENMTNNETQSLYLRWNDSLDYKVTVKSRNDQYNAPVTLFIKIGTLAAGQEKYTTLFWYDASESTYYYDAYDEGDEEWATNPSYLVDGYPWFYASTNTNNDVELLTSTTYESGGQGVVSKVELRVYGYDEGNTKIKLRPVFGGTTDGSLYEFTPGSSGAWSSWFDITNDGNAPETWSWSDIAALDVDVVSGLLFGQVNIYASKIELRVTYTVNHAPQITNPVPADDAVGVALIPLLSITVSDEEKDTMDITWLSNSSGSWQQFGSNTSVSDGTFYQVYENATEYGQWWYWRVNVTDGTNYTLSNIYKFYTGYQSKITNTGVSSFKGYLLIQVQFYNTTSSNWTVADDTVNESTPRTLMTVGSPSSGWILGLDTIFNGLVNTDNLSSFGNGTYRIYAAFRDLYGNVLMCDDETLLEAYYEFDIAFS
ncbi:MAG: hypothetical protein KKG04_05395 [Candidatus Thermoplasmatota archaeon]|nr:hypothetical protein [Candidatus Thermoplasmatota archaeon]